MASMTPSRPAPVPPTRTTISPSHSLSTPSAANSASMGSAFSSTSYSASFPTFNHTSTAIHPASARKKRLIRTGYANVKEEGLRSFLWSKRWLVLDETDLAVFKNEVSSELPLRCG